MQARPYLPILIVSFYGLAIVVGQKLMEKRDPFKWRTGLVRAQATAITFFENKGT